MRQRPIVVPMIPATPCIRTRRYASALLALGLSAAVSTSFYPTFARGADDAQAIEPVNVNGAKPAVPDAAVPTAATPSAPTQPVATPAAPAPTPPQTPAAPVVTQVTPPPTASEPNGQAVVPAAIAAPAAATAATPSAAEPAAAVPTPAAPAAAAAPAAVAAPAAATPAVEAKPVETAQPAVPATPNTPSTSTATPTAAAPETPSSEPTTVASTSPATEPVAATSQAAPAMPDSSAVATAQDGKAYPVSGIKIDYFKPQLSQPPIEELMNTDIKLGVVKDGLVAPRPGIPAVTMHLSEIGHSGPQKIYRSAILAVYLQCVRFYNARGIIGVFAVVDAKDIDANDNDIRPPERTTLQFIIVTSSIKQVRTLATGNQVPNGERVDNPRYERIRDHSPLKAGADGQGDLLNKDALDDYVLRLNRQPGRRVDVAISGTGQLGGVNLDYLVAENRPWYVYAQASNTGTSQTSVWRERVGFVDNQLTGHDDILTLDYSTAAFDTSNAVVASYELPFFSFDRTRYRVYGSWNEYVASDVGQSQAHFTGSEWNVGNELTANVFQKGDFFVDLIGGFRFQNVQTTNEQSATKGNADYASPYVAVRAERNSDLASTNVTATLISYLTDADSKDIEPLGRADTDRDSVVLQVEASQSFYIEPLLNPNAFAEGKSTLAHEFYFSAHGQYAFDYRLIPQDQDVAGGLYSVRGYPESIVAGDTVAIFTSEYRLHIPRLFPIQPDPTKTPFLWDKSFRASPQQPYGRPDWDLITRVFLDVGRVLNNDRAVTESDSTLVGTGVGLELQYKQNFNIRADWGMALKDLESTTTDEVHAGSNRFHISATLLY